VLHSLALLATDFIAALRPSAGIISGHLWQCFTTSLPIFESTCVRQSSLPRLESDCDGESFSLECLVSAILECCTAFVCCPVS
jgi:hypothetical protein